MKTHEQVVDELNSIINHDRKFGSIMGVDIPYAKTKVEFKGGNEFCVVYACWDYEGFLKYVYTSILCQIENTDILDYDLRVFVSNNIKDFAVPLLTPLIGKKRIVIVQNGLCYKHGVSTHPELSRFEVLSFCDSDAFVFSNNRMAYKELYNYHIKNKTTALCFVKINHHAIDGKAMFDKRVELTEVDYSSEFENDLSLIGDTSKFWEFIDREEWPWSCHFSVHNDFLKRPEVRSFILACLHRGIK